jgi:hypothetical protein
MISQLTTLLVERLVHSNSCRWISVSMDSKHAQSVLAARRISPTTRACRARGLGGKCVTAATSPHRRMGIDCQNFHCVADHAHQSPLMCMSGVVLTISTGQRNRGLRGWSTLMSIRKSHRIRLGEIRGQLCCNLSDSNIDRFRQRLGDKGEDVGWQKRRRCGSGRFMLHCQASLDLVIRSGAHAEHKSRQEHL